MPALLTSLQSVWLNQPPQASSDYLSVQLGCSAAQGNLCYIVNNHTCSTTSPPGERGRDSSPPEQEGLILSKTEIDLPPTTSAAKKAQQTLRHCCHQDQGGRQSTAAALGNEWRPQSPLSGKKPEAKLQDARRLRRKPLRSRRPRHKQGGKY